ncbi:hypothetical protein TNCV_3345561 [Trichonephila clavipes]|nr:hypothetical protein TNCV_3345561 [Trichonephila clavipes]
MTALTLTIFYVLEHSTVLIFHRQSRCSAKNNSFSAVKAVVDVSEGRFDQSTFRSERTNEASTLTITPKRSSSRDVGTSSYRYHTATDACENAVRCLSTSTLTAPNGFASGSFLMLSNVSELFTHLLPTIFQVQLASDMVLEQALSSLNQLFVLSSSLKSMFPTEHCHQKSQQEYCGLQLKISFE